MIILTVTAFSLSQKNSALSFAEIGNFSTAFFAAVHAAILLQFSRKSLTPAFICVLHTFGRDLKFNPHIHVLLAEGGLTKSGKWQELGFLSYESLRKSFQTILLKKLHEKLGDSFKKVKAEVYKTAQNGFYVNAPKPKNKIQNAIKYVGRYLGRPVIASSRIDKYDGNFVTFHYDRHEDGERVVETIPAREFIKRIVIHIPEKYFNMVRFYGLYAQNLAIVEKVGRLLKTKNRRILFRDFLLQTFGVDPLLCKKCGQYLRFVELHHTPENVISFKARGSP